MKNKILGVLCVAVLTGCGAKWVNLDNSQASNSKIKKAMSKCRVDDRIYQINEERNINDVILDVSGMKEEEKEKIRKANKLKEDKAYQAIYDCMKKEGLKQEK